MGLSFLAEKLPQAVPPRRLSITTGSKPCDTPAAGAPAGAAAAGEDLPVAGPTRPATGATQLALDPLELIHRLAQQIPDPRQHLVRYYGSYANRARQLYRPASEELDGGGPGGPELDPDANAESEFATERRRNWARLLRKMPGAVLMQSLQSGARSGALVPGRETAAGSSPTPRVERNGLEALPAA